MLQGGGSSFEDIRELRYEEGLMKLIDINNIPDPDSVGGFLSQDGQWTYRAFGIKRVRRSKG